MSSPVLCSDLIAKKISVDYQYFKIHRIFKNYSLFKRDLYNDLVANNLNLSLLSGKTEKEIKLMLFKKLQKLLDRFLFIFFGEDRGLLPANSISKIIEKWEYDTEWGDSKPLYGT